VSKSLSRSPEDSPGQPVHALRVMDAWQSPASSVGSSRTGDPFRKDEIAPSNVQANA
jgi:hypothetical protein